MKRIVTLLAILCPVIAVAQQPDAPSDHALDEVVVTANKFDQKASETGKVVRVISGQDLEHSSGKSLSQLLNEQAGITINGANQTPGSVQYIYTRGADPQYTLILLDGIPVKDASSISNFFDLNLIPLSMIERIEIIRGGYASLYGSGTASAVINIITKKGGTRPFNANAALSAGSYGAFMEQAGIRGGTAKVDYSLQFQNMDSRGFSAARDSSGDGHFDKDGFHRQFVMGEIGFHPGTSWTLRPYLRYSWEKGALDNGAYQDDKDYHYSTRFFQTGVDIAHSFQGGDLHVKYDYQPTVRHYLNDSSDGSAFLKQPFTSYTHEADAYAHWVLTPRMTMLLGTALRTEKTTQSTLSISSWGESYSKVSGDSASTSALNVYGSYILNAGGGFRLETSGRLTEHKTYGIHPVFAINPSWTVHDRIKLFANVSTSYNSPSLYQLYTPIYGNTGLKPETGLNLEAGAEAYLAGKRLTLSLTGFARDQKHVIAFQMDPATYAYRYVNYNHQRLYGGEFEGDFRITDRLHARAYYAYVSGKVTARNDATGKDSTYHDLFRKPTHSAGASLGYQVLNDLYLSLEGKYTGLRKDLVYDAGGHQVTVDMHGYVLVNFYAQYVWKKKYKAYLGLYNVTNSHYAEMIGYTTKRFNFEAGLQWSLF